MATHTNRRVTDDAAGTRSPQECGRTARRFKTFWPTSLRADDDVRRAHILNISRAGAKIHAQQPLDVGCQLEIAICEGWHCAAVRWRSGSTFGIALDQTIADDVLMGKIESAGSDAAADPRDEGNPLS